MFRFQNKLNLFVIVTTFLDSLLPSTSKYWLYQGLTVIITVTVVVTTIWIRFHRKSIKLFIGLQYGMETCCFILYRGILVYNICLISISKLVFECATKKRFWILKEHSTVNSANEYEPDVLNTFWARLV